MKQLVLFTLSILIAVFTSAQDQIRFSYDSYGNRTERKYVLSVEKTRSVIAGEEDGEGQTGMEEMKREIRIYPNPTKGHLQIETSGCLGKTGLRLYSSSGQLLQQSETGDPAISLDLTEYPQGTYLLWLMFGKDREEYKIIKQ